MTQNGIDRVSQSAKTLVGQGALIDPTKLSCIFVSPRTRAQQTLTLLSLDDSIERKTTEDITEWDYGKYEGLTSKQINEQLGGDVPWNVFRDGCPEGDTAATVTERIDKLIIDIRERHHRAQNKNEAGDILVVAHGHILRAFALRWIGQPVVLARHLTYDAGGASRLGYEHGNLDEPTIDVWNVTPENQCQ